MGTIRYDSLPIVIDGKCVYYKTVKHTVASEIVFATSGKNPMVWLKVEGRQAPEHECGKHEITSAREGSGEAPPQRNVTNSNLKIVQFSVIK